MKRIIKIITALMLSVIMAVSHPLSVFAAQNTYISDIKIGYGEHGKEALIAAGYKVWENLDANKGGIYEQNDGTYGESVYIGYKTTSDKEDAITDIGVMNMAGNYSYSDWEDEVEAAWAEAERKVDRFQCAIETFRDNYEDSKSENNNSFSELAYRMLSFYYEDDTNQTIGDFFLNEETTHRQMDTLFMQGNTTCLRGIEYYLALGCLEYDGDTFLKRISEADVYSLLSAEEDEDEEDEEDDPFAEEEFEEEETEPETVQTLDESVVPLNQAVSIIIDAIKYTKLTVQEYRNMVSNMQSFVNEEAYLETLDEENKATYLIDKQVYTILKNTPYGNLEGVTLLDIVDLSETTRNEMGLVLNNESIAPLAKCMTAAQIGLLEFVGLDTLLVMADAMKDDASAEAYRTNIINNISEMEKEYKGESVSVYDGVDRSLFTDVENIALTGEAVKNRAIAEGTEFGRKTEKHNNLITVLLAVGFVTFAGGLAFTYAAFYAHQIIEVNISFAKSLVLQLGAVVCILAGIVMVLISEYGLKSEVVYEDVNYTKIPRILVDIKTTTNKLNRREEKHYVPYYAAYNIEAADDETDTTKLFGDLNGLSGKAQWLVLYYTKDELAGEPLKAGNLLVKEGESFTTSELSGYKALHILGNTNPENLNQYHVNGAVSLYVAVPTTTTTGSVFADSNILNVLAAVGIFVSGGVISMLLTKGYYKRKKA